VIHEALYVFNLICIGLHLACLVECNAQLFSGDNEQFKIDSICTSYLGCLIVSSVSRREAQLSYCLN
jgi:hypothetical protein